MFKYLLPIKPPYSELDSVVKLLFHPLCPVYFDSMVWSLFTAKKKKKATKQKKTNPKPLSNLNNGNQTIFSNFGWVKRVEDLRSSQDLRQNGGGGFSFLSHCTIWLSQRVWVHSIITLAILNHITLPACIFKFEFFFFFVHSIFIC